MVYLNFSREMSVALFCHLGQKSVFDVSYLDLWDHSSSLFIETYRTGRQKYLSLADYHLLLWHLNSFVVFLLRNLNSHTSISTLYRVFNKLQNYYTTLGQSQSLGVARIWQGAIRWLYINQLKNPGKYLVFSDKM